MFRYPSSVPSLSTPFYILLIHLTGYELHPKVKASYQAGRCTYSSTSNVFAPQHWYQCRTCNMVDSLGKIPSSPFAVLLSSTSSSQHFLILIRMLQGYVGYAKQHAMQDMM